MTVTMLDVARSAGVDKSTVSLVLSGKRSGLRISRPTRDRILAAAKVLNYRPSFSAQALRKGRTFTLGLVCGGIESAFFSELTSLAIREAQERGYQLLVSVTEWDTVRELECLEMLRDGRVEGVLMLTTALTPEAPQYESIVRDGFPVVVMHSVPGLSSVSSDWTPGMDQAVRHLKAGGHGRVGYVWLGTDMFSDRAKQSAFQKACATHGAAGIEYTCSGSITDARELGRRLDHEPDCPGAFIVFSDYIAGGVIRGLVDEGRRVPEDTAVVGMDGTAMGEFSTPALTTIAQDCRQLMVRSIDLLLEKIEHRETSAKEILLPTQLIVRESA